MFVYGRIIYKDFLDGEYERGFITAWTKELPTCAPRGFIYRQYEYQRKRG